MGVQDRKWYADAIREREAREASQRAQNQPQTVTRTPATPRDRALKRIDILVKIALWLGVIAFVYNRARHLGLL
ncbi:hypothetical protein R77564_00263 [Ralstonia sp. LMG 32965]|uniref:Transmembrane protein n=1 Tax=Ralstonia flatus TaxID=3058601 RepID=A0ABN9JWZ6_9RALS|nr:hypothetical protein R77564_00263 [Ralstonia sp. LMG 32965]